MKKSCLAMALCAWLTACAAGPPARIYLLSAAASVESRTGAAGAPVQLQTVQVPDYMDTTDILLRAGRHEIVASRTGRWGERLSQGITHALQVALAGHLAGRSVTLNPPADPSAAQLLVMVDSFDVWPDGHCELTTHWVVLQTPASASGRTGQAVFTSPAAVARGAMDSLTVSAMAAAVDLLALRIASDLGGVGGA